MFIVRFEDCEEFIAGDNTILREFLHPDKQDVHIRYSLAHARLEKGKTSQKHTLRTSEVYYILKGKGLMFINDETQEVVSGCTVYIPPFATQCIENTGDELLEFLCIVDPCWRMEDEVIL